MSTSWATVGRRLFSIFWPPSAHVLEVNEGLARLGVSRLFLSCQQVPGAGVRRVSARVPGKGGPERGRHCGGGHLLTRQPRRRGIVERVQPTGVCQTLPYRRLGGARAGVCAGGPVGLISPSGTGCRPAHHWRSSLSHPSISIVGSLASIDDCTGQWKAPFSRAAPPMQRKAWATRGTSVAPSAPALITSANPTGALSTYVAGSVQSRPTRRPAFCPFS